MEKNKGVSMMMVSECFLPDEIIATDACLEGCGGWMEREYFHPTFPPEIQKSEGMETRKLYVFEGLFRFQHDWLHVSVCFQGRSWSN